MTYSVDSKILSNFVKLTFDNTQATDIKSLVIPNFEKNLGGVEGLLAKIEVDKASGVRSMDVDLRKKAFGVNKVEEEPQDSIWKLMWEALQDPTLVFLSVAAFFSLFIALVVEGRPYGWLEGAAILFAVVVVVLVGSINDYQKEIQFRELNSKKDDVQVTVLRDGNLTQVSTFDLVVGDLVILSTGDLIPADGIVLGRNDLEISEKMLTGETYLKKKSDEYVIVGNDVVSSPTLFAGTFVQAGEGRMLVLAVGVSTYQGSMEQKMKEAESGRSILQKKLDAMTELITSVSMYVSILLVVILSLRMGYAFYAKKCCMESWKHDVHWSELLGFVITGITIFVVAVPEGLPLAVTIALAFSVKKMLADKNLVRHLSACETMGGATTICSDKTGTLTTSRMTVVKVWVAGAVYSDMNMLAQSLPNMREKIAVAAVVNTFSKTYLKTPPGGESCPPIYCGNDTECALLLLADQLGVPYQRVRAEYRDDHPARRSFSFSSDRKRMSTLVIHEGAPTVFTKGAPEIVVALCTSFCTGAGAVQPIDAAARRAIDAAISSFAEEGLRTLCIASRVLPPGAVAGDAAAVERDLGLICLVGIEDPLRPEVPGAIQDCKRAGIVVRMVTGDNVQTATAIARKCGIVADGAEAAAPGVILDGKAFREAVCDAEGAIVQQEFDKVWPALRVLARSTPLDKYLLVTGMQASEAGPTRQTVAVTGDGTNDAPALKRADVGFAMGIQGTDVAKNASDVIIMDDNFVSIVAAVRWGRCVYDNICKFLQFQLTVNITACMLACVGAAVLTESPLSALQMLWVNLIMDSMASLALATEGPNQALLDRKPYPRDQAVLSQTMVRNMLCHAAWQLAVLTALIFGLGDVCHGAGDICEGQVLVDKYGALRSGRPPAFDMGGLEGACPPVYNASDPSTADGTGQPLRAADFCSRTHTHGAPTRHYTIVFNVFVLLQLFNEVNARKIHGELNVLRGVARHGLFLAVVAGTLLVQVALVEVRGLNAAFGCTRLTAEEWLACVLLGSTSIPMNAVFHLVPPALFPSGGGGLPPDDEAEGGAGAGGDGRKKDD